MELMPFKKIFDKKTAIVVCHDFVASNSSLKNVLASLGSL
jgi:hypothetical protein